MKLNPYFVPRQKWLKIVKINTMPAVKWYLPLFIYLDFPWNKQTDGNFIDNKKSQLDFHVMCIHGIQQKTKTKHRQTFKII